MSIEAKMGEPICLELPQGSGQCDIAISPRPKHSSYEYDPACGIQLQVYEPGQFTVSLTCQSTQASAQASSQTGVSSQTLDHQIKITPPTGLQQDLQYRVQPWVDMPPAWGLWTAQGIGILGVLIAMLLTARWAWRRWQAYRTGRAHAAYQTEWEPEVFLKRLRQLENDYHRQNVDPKSVAFELTRLFFDIAMSTPYSGVQKTFHQGYEDTLEKFYELKFNPHFAGNHTDMDGFFVRYTSELRRAIDRHQKEHT